MSARNAACSRAILVSNRCGGAIDLVQNGINGFIFKNNSLYSLVEKMNLLAKNKESLIKMGECSSKIIDKWSFENICVQVEYLVNKYCTARK